jgi:hypothetical protein
MWRATGMAFPSGSWRCASGTTRFVDFVDKNAPKMFFVEHLLLTQHLQLSSLSMGDYHE